MAPTAMAIWNMVTLRAKIWYFSSHSGYGEGPAEAYRTAELAARRVAQIFASSNSRHRSRLTLRDLRELYECHKSPWRRKPA